MPSLVDIVEVSFPIPDASTNDKPLERYNLDFITLKGGVASSSSTCSAFKSSINRGAAFTNVGASLWSSNNEGKSSPLSKKWFCIRIHSFAGNFQPSLSQSGRQVSNMRWKPFKYGTKVGYIIAKCTRKPRFFSNCFLSKVSWVTTRDNHFSTIVLAFSHFSCDVNTPIVFPSHDK